jgi:hypothetical protein
VKVVFLDVDGVLNSGEFLKGRHFDPDPAKSDDWYVEALRLSYIDPKAIARLNRITDATGAKIVVSSSWRHYFIWGKGLKEFFAKAGVKAEILGRTFTDPDDVRKTLHRFGVWYDRVFRGHEIHAWIVDWNDQEDEDDVESIAILDDGTDMEYLSHRLVNTQFEVGLTDADADTAIALLNTPAER